MGGVSIVDRMRRVDRVAHVLEDRTQTGILYIGITEKYDASPTEEVWQIQRSTFDIDGNFISKFALDAKYLCKWSDRTSYFDAPPVNRKPFPDELSVIVGSVTLNENISDAYHAKAVAANTAYNLVPPLTGKNFLVTGLLIGTDENIGLFGTEVELYTASLVNSTTVIKTIGKFNIVKNSVVALELKNVLVEATRFLNIKTTVPGVYATIYGLYKDV